MQERRREGKLMRGCVRVERGKTNNRGKANNRWRRKVCDGEAQEKNICGAEKEIN